MTLRFARTLVVGVLAGCTGSSAVPPGPGGGNDGAITTAPDAGAPDMVLPGTTTMTTSIGPIMLAAGEERTVCSQFRLPNAGPIDIVRFTTVLAPGSHHLIFYKSMATTEHKEIYPCKPLDVFGTKDVPLYIAESEYNNTLPLPSGVAYHFEAGQMVRLEAHYLNASSKPLLGKGTVDLAIGPPANYQKADIMFCGSVTELAKNGVAPHGDTTLSPGFYVPPAGTKIFGLTTHQHARGSLMEIAKSSGAGDVGTNLVMGKPYDNPPFPVWGDKDLLTFEPGEGLRWVCHYKNDSDKTYKFGESAESNEMCFLWAYYFPSAGRFISMECLR